MSRILVICLVLLIGCSKTKTKEPTANLPVDPAWELIWSDEFNYSGLPNADYWSFEKGYVRNAEKQYYTDKRLDNCIVKNGFLQITALNDSFQNHEITSASIETINKVSFNYGRIEARAKMPKLGSGSWPAIWTKGTNYNTVGWPYCGEIDIMEWVGKSPSVILGSIFSKAKGSPSLKSSHAPYFANHSAFLTDEFHVYAIEWDSTKVSYFIDNINYGTISKENFGPDWDPITKPHYLKLNLAMGGTIPPIGGGGTIDYTKFPFTFLVDYVRYYKKL